MYRWWLCCLLYLYLYLGSISDGETAKTNSTDSKSPIAPVISLIQSKLHRPVDLDAASQTYYIGETVRVAAGQNVTLLCKATGDPTPTYQWKKGETVVSKQGTVMASGGTLTISRVTSVHGGMYQCEASNSQSTARKSSVIKVYGGTSFSCSREFVETKTTSFNLSLSCPSGNASDPYDCHLTDYSVSLSTSTSTQDRKTAKSVISKSSTILLEQLIPFTLYNIYVTAVYNHGYCKSTAIETSGKTRPTAPTPPRNVRTTRVTDTSASVSWDTPAAWNGTIVSYSVKYNSETVSSNASPGQVHKILLTNLSPYTKYEVNVRAWAKVDSQFDFKGKRSVHTFVTLQGKPSIPLNVRAARQTLYSSILISWQSPAIPNGRISYYIINYVVGSSTVVASARTTKGLPVQSSYELTQLSAFTAYTVWVQAVNVEKSNRLISDRSNSTRFKTLSNAPTQPRQLQSSRLPNASVHLQWLPPETLNGVIAKYKIVVAEGESIDPRTHNGKTLAVPSEVGGSVNRAKVSGLAQLTWYTVWIVAVNVRETDDKELTSPPSNILRFSTLGGPRSVPQNVHSSVTAVSAVITWETPPDLPTLVTVYRVRYYNVTSDPNKRVGYKDVRRSRSVRLGNLLPYTLYRAKIAAFLENGLWTRYSSPHIFRTNQTSPSPPRSVSIQAGTIGARTVSVSWSKPLYANGVLQKYRVYITRSGVSNAPSDLRRGVQGPLKLQTQIRLRGLTPVTTYRVWVSAINVADNGTELISQLSKPVQFTTIAEASSPPRNVSYSNVTSNSVVVMWLRPRNVHGTLAKYSVSLMSSLRGQIGKLRQSVVTNENTLSATFQNLVPFTRYVIEVRAGTIRDHQNSNRLLWSDPNEDEPPINFTTKQSFPSSPVNLTTTMIFSRSVWIRWDRPNHPNGVIRFYQVSLLVKRNGTGSINGHERNLSWEVTHTDRTKNSSTRIKINLVSPYTKYKVTVSAVNVMDGVELVGNDSKQIDFMTTDEQPAAPSSCAVAHKNAMSINITWQPPWPFDYQIVYYNVTYYTSDRGTSTFSLVFDNHHTQLNFLFPFTKYNITVTAFTNNSRLWQGPPCYLQTQTRIGTPPAPTKPQIPVNMTKTPNTVTLSLPPLNETNGPIRSVQVIVVELKRGVSWSEDSPLPKPRDNRVVTQYVAKELFDSQRDQQFVVGANENSNVLLKPNTTYAFYVQWIAQEEGSGKQLMSTSPAIVYSTAPLLRASSSPSNIYLIPVIVLLLLTLSIVVMILIIRIRKKRSRVKCKSLSEQSHYGLESKDIPLESLSATQNRDDIDQQPVYANCMLSVREKGEVSIAEFEKRIATLKADDNKEFIVEFEELAKVGFGQSSEFARKRENANKNRYHNIVSYDDYCLMLDEVDGMDRLETRYINATFLDGSSRSNEYIVAQGPLPNTYADFWRMIWIEKAETVVMLTRTVENGKTKCYQYWSDDEPKLCEGLTVEVALRTEMADYTVRTMKLELKNKVRTVTHYHFKSWPDHDVPAYATDLLGLIYRVRRDVTVSTVSPLVVHCSAGVGRSGAYVAIDSLFRCLSFGQKIDVKSTVKQMRMRRTEMVQSVIQYIFVHDSVLEAYYTSTTEIPVSDFSSRLSTLHEACSLSGSKKIDQEFSILIKISPLPDKSAFITGMHPTVLTRQNRDPSFIPPDSTRVTLNVDDDSTDAVYANTTLGADYINASFINGYYKRNFFIVTQAPLPCTITDMWKMVYEQGASAIVNLAQQDEHEQYWPESGSQSYGNLKVDFLSSENRKTFTVYKLQLSKRQSMSHISLFHFTSWPNDAPPSDISGLIEMKRQLRQWMAVNNGRRMIVHCCTGMGRTGVFCAVYNILDQIKCEGIVNVLHVAKLLRNQRPGIIQTPEQYETTYKIIDCCQQPDAVYANL